MNFIKSNQETSITLFSKKNISELLKNIYSLKSNESLIHEHGKICRDGGDLFDLEHETVDGLYLRRMSLNKGTCIVSGIHKRDHVWILLQGSIKISSELGEEEYSAPWVGYSQAGTQRLIYASEYSVFQNVFKNPNNLTYLDDLEEYNYCTTLEEYEKYKKNKQNK